MHTSILSSVRSLIDAGHLVGAALLFAGFVAGASATTANLVSASVGDSLDGPAITIDVAQPERYAAMSIDTISLWKLI